MIVFNLPISGFLDVAGWFVLGRHDSGKLYPNQQALLQGTRQLGSWVLRVLLVLHLDDRESYTPEI